MTEPVPERLQEQMDKFGYTEQEARIAVHLDEAEKLLFELRERDAYSDGGGSKLGNIIWRDTHIREHFATLHRQLGVRVLRRDYPEGWGYVPPGDNDKANED